MTYTFTYNGTDSPTWEKIFTAQGGETFSVSLVFENKEDRDHLTAEQVFEHLENMLQYVKDRTADLSLIQLDEEPPTDTYWPVHGNYDDVEKCMEEIQKWWDWAYYNEAFDTETE